jgi:DNA-binding transcriptional ArsR family regulator
MSIDNIPQFDTYGNMKNKEAINAFAALSQETRLDVFRLLIKTLPEAMPAGDIAKEMDVPPSTMSTHLAILSRAGLVKSERNGRVISYAADLNGVRDLLAFLVKDCCSGKSKACNDLIEAVLPACC